ncbi:hypothetical protein RhiLY_10869 [Ceratobasidium sp. AG-Ba]|nr:hypothetical protein RhiLY_10869 [Ceratobasidium sp. AG-Ba]
MQPFSPHPSVQLPVTNTRRDAYANQKDNGGTKLSVADSLVLLQSLKQSRAAWLTKAFLRFSTRSKNKADQPPQAPPPHTLSLAGICDIEIGPHLFPQTSIYFVQYQYNHSTTAAPIPKVTQTPAPPPPSTPTATSTSSQPQPGGPITVSHELHAKVLAAAAKDPDLHTILQLAAQGKASVPQLRVLGAAIKAIEAGTHSTQIASATGTPSSSSGSAPAASTAPTSRHPASAPASSTTSQASGSTVTASKPATTAPTQTTPASLPNAAPRAPTAPTIPTTAILLEFAERPIDRWLLPSEYVLLEKTSNGDVLLSTFYPFDAYVPSGGIGPNGVAARSKPAHPLTMRFLAAPVGVWSALSRTCTTVSPSGAQSVLAEVITNVPARTYLQYRIAPGPLWEDLKAKNPSAQSVLLPSIVPKPSASVQSRRAEDPAGGTAKKRRANTGNSGTSTPATKGKGKEKEKGGALSGVQRPAPTQPATVATTTALPSAAAPSQPPPNIPIPTATTPGLVPLANSVPLPAPVAVAKPAHVQPSTVGPIPKPTIPEAQAQPEGGTLNQALPPFNPTPRPPVQHVSAGRPGEGVKVLGAGASPASGAS